MGGPTSRWRPRLAIAGLTVWAATLAVLLPGSAQASHMSWWVHDHSATAIPARPSGLSQIVSTFGQACNGHSDDSRSYWPSQSARGVGGYVYTSPYLARNIDYNVRDHIDADHRNLAVDYGVYGYACRQISGSTSWSTHAWGAAVDTNSARNPLGQTFWDGHGSNGTDYGTYIPAVWRGADPGHRFYWGLNFASRPDPMHFQYAINY